MDGFELHMDETGLNQKREGVFVIVQKMLKPVQTLHHLCWRWWDKGCISRTTTPNPVLRTTEFTGSLVRTTSTPQQYRVNFPDQPQGQRKSALEAAYTMLHGC